MHVAALRLMFCLYHDLFNNTLMMVMQGGVYVYYAVLFCIYIYDGVCMDYYFQRR